MSDELTRAIREAVALPGCGCLSSTDRWVADPDNGDPHGCYCECDPDYDPCDHDKADRIAAALAPLIEARVREARASELEDAARSIQINNWVDIFKGPLPERLGNSQRAVDWLRERAQEVRRG